MNDEIIAMLKEWKKTRAIHTACEIADKLYDEVINEETDN